MERCTRVENQGCARREVLSWLQDLCEDEPQSIRSFLQLIVLQPHLHPLMFSIFSSFTPFLIPTYLTNSQIYPQFSFFFERLARFPGR